MKGLVSGLVLVLVIAATATGVFYKTEEPPLEHLTVRGEQAVFWGSGLYRYDPVSIAREGIIWDTINLLIGVPLLGVGILLARRGSLRGRLLQAGLLSYFFYVYLMYATMMAFNPLFLLYVAIFSLSLVGCLKTVTAIDIADLPNRVEERFPRRVFAAYMLMLAAMVTLLWMGLVVPITMTNSFPAELAGVSTLESQALDLGLIVPLSLAAGLLLWRRAAWGYLLTGIGITHGLMMFISIPAWVVVPLLEAGTVNLAEAIPFGILCIIGIVLAVRFYRDIDRTAGPARE
jgi:hypothetical protein